MKVAIYSRKSIYTGKGESIENQIEMCKDYYKRLYPNNNAEFIIYEDEGFSGGNVNRPKFQKLLKDVKNKAFDVLICYRLDRISRNVADFSSTLELLQQNNVDFISIKEQFDTSSPMGRAMIYISSVFAQLERETIAERVRDNMIQLSKTGRWLGGFAPLGFTAIKETFLDENMKERSLSKLTVDKEEMRIVKDIFNKYLETESLNQVAKWTMENNFKGRLGGDMDKSAINIILQNPAYVKSTPEVLDFLSKEGFTVYGEANGNGLLRYAQNGDNKIVAVAKHKGIIEADDWLKVQKILKANTVKAPNQGKTNKAILTGILKCGKCGANMNVKYGSAYKNNPAAFYYKCASKIKSSGVKCDASNIKGDVAERLIVDVLGSYNKEQLFLKLQTLLTASKTDCKFKSKDVESEIKDYEDKIKRLISKLSLTDDIDISNMFMDQIKQYKEHIKKLKSELDVEIEKEIDVILSVKEMEEVADKLDRFNILFDKSTTDEKIKLLNDVLDKIVWNEETRELEVFYKLSKKK